MLRARPRSIDGATRAPVTIRRWIAVAATALCAAGCFSDRGLAIEVDIGETGATRVDLYIGKVACDPKHNPADIDCKAIAPPPDGATSLPGAVWFRDADAEYSVAVTGHTATFQLKADAATTLPIVVAVGYDATMPPRSPVLVGTATLRDVPIPTASARIVTATLAAAHPMVVNPPSTTGLTDDRVLVWTRLTSPSTCVAVERWVAGNVTRDFVVPDDDPDCDGVVRECNPSAFLGSEPGGLSPVADCLIGGGPQPCVLGSLPCTDAGGLQVGSCGALQAQICLPSQFCSCPMVGPETYPYSGCMTGQLDVFGSAVPRIECDVPMRPDFKPCTNNNKDTGGIQLDMASPTARCEQPLLGTIQLTGFAISQPFRDAVMELSDPNDRCDMTIRWKSGTRTTTDPNDHGVIRVPTARGALLVPIVFHFHLDTCLTLLDFSCRFLGNAGDTLWSCASSR